MSPELYEEMLEVLTPLAQRKKLELFRRFHSIGWEDLLQDALLKASRSVDDMRREHRFRKHVIYTAGHQAILDRLKSEKRERSRRDMYEVNVRELARLA